MAAEIRIIRPTDAPSSPGAAIGFTAPIAIHRVGAALGTDDVQVNALYFGAGERSRPHIHPWDQVLYYPLGTGVVAIGGGEDQLVEPGSFVVLPGNVVHMHGAADGGPAWHISMMGQSSTSYDMEVPAAWRRWVL